MLQALTKQRVNAMQVLLMIISCKRQLCVKALAQSEGVPFGLSSIANALPSSVSQVEEVPKYPNKNPPWSRLQVAKAGANMREKMRQNVLTMLRPLEKVNQQSGRWSFNTISAGGNG